MKWKRTETHNIVKSLCVIAGDLCQRVSVVWYEDANSADIVYYIGDVPHIQRTVAATDIAIAEKQAINVVEGYLKGELRFWQELTEAFHSSSAFNAIHQGVQEAIAYEKGQICARETVLTNRRRKINSKKLRRK